MNKKPEKSFFTSFTTYLTLLILAFLEPEASTIKRINEPENKTIPLYEKYELSFDLDCVFSNPFDPEEANVNALIEAPSGKKWHVPAFYYQEFSRNLYNQKEHVTPLKKSEWKIRYSPVETGAFFVDIYVNEQKATSTPLKFDCVPGAEKGFVRIARNYHSFRFDKGDSYYPIGHNMRFPSSKQFGEGIAFQKGSFLYEEIMHKMSLHGENFLVIGMEAWWLGLEWSGVKDSNFHGIGKYNLKNAWLFDQILNKAWERDIRIALFLSSHGQFAIKSKDWPDGHWKESPYNKKNGGPLLSPVEFFKNDFAKKKFKDMLRYIVARWGYSPNIFSWLLLSEADLTQSYLNRLGSLKWNEPLTDLGPLTSWHQEIGSYLKAIDPWKHLVSTSFAFISHGESVWKLPQMDFIFNTAFISEFGDNSIDIIRSYDKLYRDFQKPYLLAEYGGHARWNEEVELLPQYYCGIWAQYMMPRFSGCTGFWWWALVESRDLYRYYKALADFHLNETRCQEIFESIEDVEFSDPSLGMMAIGNQNKHYLWIYDKSLLYLKDFLKDHENEWIQYRTFLRGAYEAEFWNTEEGEPFARIKVNSDMNGMLKLPLPNFKGDLAIKVRRREFY